MLPLIIMLCRFSYHRSSATSTVYHLLQRKLKKYYVKHPGKAERTMNDVTYNSESVRDSRGAGRDKENRNSSKKRAECAVATVNVCDFNNKEESTPNEAGLETKNLAVPAFREELSSPSRENLSKLEGELSENTTSPQGDQVSAESETNGDASGEQRDRTCSILSDAGIEISRKTSVNYSSVEVMGVNGRKLSMNLSHISLESKATFNKESNEQNGQEGKESAVNSHEVSPRRTVETKSITSQERTSPRHSGPNTPAIGKVSLINAKIISIPLQQMKLDSPDKVIA